MKGTFCIVLLEIVFALAPVSEGPKDPPKPATTQPAKLTKSEIARRVEATLRNAKYGEGTTEVSEIAPPLFKRDDPMPPPRVTLVIKFNMAPDALKSVVHKDDKIVAEFSFYEGKSTEYVGDGKSKGWLVDYKAPLPNGSNDIKVGVADWCLMSNHVYSWVGVPLDNDLPLYNDLAGSMREKIELGSQEEDAVVADHSCYVFRQKIGSDETLQHVVYIDQETFLWRRWDTVYPDKQRIRRNDMRICNAPPADISWTIQVPGR